MNVKTTQPDIQIRQGKLEAVQSFKYLEATITKDGKSTSEIKTRIAIATGTLSKLNVAYKLIWKDKNVPIATKIRLMRAITVSTTLYGCESWTMTAETERRIQASEIRCLRRILRIPYTAHRTYVSVWTEITDEVGPQEHLISTIERRKMRWIGHVNRLTSLAKLIMQISEDGKKGRGRLRTACMVG